ncbi:DUF4190 domain-containing protein [Bifidobacterium callimiconis]|uniref:DUF4190 domain-containing protein n=1 Tax=Bifidobacterium callimiconis TaxID=2306973 RepID=A0A430FG85_9BIFI|nr:DUF4190 domain-containing protein [Bifidobacterium callimiconis]RSX51837.1 hypothetical protein D2E23_0444 [Bifidobacterium callimiconis]
MNTQNPQNADSQGNQDHGSGRADQPEYGQYAQPEYGQMANQYPGWNPYVYGAPEPDAKPEAQQEQSGNGYNGQTPQMPNADWSGNTGGNGGSYSGGSYNGGPQSPYSPYQSSPQPNRQPRYRNGINLDDPNQNPLYGRWDPAAIIAFGSALLSIPVLPVLLGAFAIWRTGLFHMKGRGLAIAAVVIGLLVTALDIYLIVTGMDAQQFILQLYGLDSYGGTGGTDSGTSV